MKRGSFFFVSEGGMKILYREYVWNCSYEVQKFYDVSLPMLLKLSAIGLLPRITGAGHRPMPSRLGGQSITVTMEVTAKNCVERADPLWLMEQIRGFIESVLRIMGSVWYLKIKDMRVVDGRLVCTRVRPRWHEGSEVTREALIETAVWKFYKSVAKWIVKRKLDGLREKTKVMMERQYQAFRKVKGEYSRPHRYCAWRDVTGGDILRWYDEYYSNRRECYDMYCIYRRRLPGVVWFERR
jgi:hypothetical protein